MSASRSAGANTLTDVARSLGGSAALSLLAGVFAPEAMVIAGAAVLGLFGGYLAKNILD